ncbi:MAG: hypothetical protein J0L72_01770 [Armatimonadetes bacterium]|nr:hypothetical protein [Armatimonadota bacterium]
MAFDPARFSDEIRGLTGLVPPDSLARFAESSPDPERASTQFLRWLAAMANPAQVLQIVAQSGAITENFFRLLGASHQMGDLCIQNPEMVSLLFEPGSTSVHRSHQLIEEGRRLLSAASSQSHRQDRLRLLNQRNLLRIAFDEIAGIDPLTTCLGVSELATAIIQLSLELAWNSACELITPIPPCPLTIVGFGKLGGSELNFSSDIDLVYVLADDASEQLEKLADRAAVIFGRGMEERMGRGALFRVDLRLRPFGNSGAIVNKWRSVEAYYQRYAEPWERQALIRSRVVAGEGEERWEALRQQTCFARPPSGVEIEQLLSQRSMIETIATGDDLKRGPGGIRDVEFLTQILQLLYGSSHLQTLDALEHLGSLGGITSGDLATLNQGYSFLRRVENRIQLEGNQQRHSLPDSPDDQLRLARSLGFDSYELFVTELNRHRASIRAIFNSVLPSSPEDGHSISGFAMLPELAKDWINSLPEAESFIAAIDQNPESQARIRTLCGRSPALIPEFKNEISISELILTGEILEEAEARDVQFGPDAGKRYRRAKLAHITRWSLDPNGNPSNNLDSITDKLLRTLLGGFPLECVAMGSYASHETTPASDCDLVLFCPEGIRHLEAEQAAQEFIRHIDSLAQEGSGLRVDLRLRPEGRSGLLARTHSGFSNYIQKDMDPWERLACSRHRLIFGSPQSLELVRDAAYGTPLNYERLVSLIEMRNRVVRERVPSSQFGRHLKFSEGMLDDIHWLIYLLEAHQNQAIRPGALTTQQKLAGLRESGALSNDEHAILADAHQIYHRSRWIIELHGWEHNLLPDADDKFDLMLDQLPGKIDRVTFTETILGVRGIFERKMNKLRGEVVHDSD